MTRRRMLGVVILVMLVLVASENLVSTAGNQVPESNVHFESIPVRIVLPDGSLLAVIKITPQSLNAGSNGPPLDAQIMLTSGCVEKDILFSTVRLSVVGGVSSISPEREITRNKEKLIVRFNRQVVIGLIGGYQGETITLEMRGRTSTGCKFTGRDTIGFMPAPVQDTSDSSDVSAPMPGGGNETE